MHIPRALRYPHTHLALSFALTTMVAFAYIVAFAERPGGELSFFLLCCVVGASGGATSSFVRQSRIIQTLDQDGLASLERNERALLLAWVAPLVGAIFAGLLLLMFAAEVLQGSLFPAFVQGGDFDQGQALFASLAPRQHKDAFKALVWSFVAGWSERLIPNIIETVSLRLQPRPPGPPA
jgi:TctA family transporter